MAIKSKNSVASVMKEVTVGTPVAPASATDYIPLQDGAFEMSPSFAELENAEIRSSIGASKPVLGLESPTCTLSVYLKHAGVEGQSPQWGELIESAFGSVEVNATQYDTVAASTVSLIKVDTGEGAFFTRGEGLLIKDGTNGYKIRPVHSISGNDLTLGFALPAGTAPALGVNLGKAVKYSVANSGHPSLTTWLYRGNDGAIEMIAGGQVTSMNMTCTAGEFINCDFEIAGTKYHFDPIKITSSNNKLDFSDGGALVATVTAKTYRTPYELASALEASMNSQGSSDVFTVTYNSKGASAGKFTIATNGATLSLLWNTGANTANTIGTKIGFLVAADDTGALTYTSDNAQAWVATYTPSYDSAEPLAAKNMEVLLGTSTNTACAGISEFSFSLENTVEDITDICAESGVEEKLITGRTVSVDFTARLTKHDAELFKQFQEGDDVRFMFAFGPKSGGNFVAGKSGCLYLPSARVSSFQVVDNNGIETVQGTLTGFVDSSGNGECYLSFL